MKRLFFLLLALFSVTISPLSAQRTAEKFFAAMPDRILPLIDQTGRLDMIDLFNSTMPARAENTYGGQSEMVQKNKHLITIKLTDASTWQMCVLTMPHDTLIACIHSVSAQGTSSTLSVYRRDWSPTLRTNLPQPDRKLMLQPKHDVAYSRAQRLLSAIAEQPVEAEFSADEPLLTFNISLEAISPDDILDAGKLVRPVSYRWAAGKWTKVD